MDKPFYIRSKPEFRGPSEEIRAENRKGKTRKQRTEREFRHDHMGWSQRMTKAIRRLSKSQNFKKKHF